MLLFEISTKIKIAYQQHCICTFDFYILMIHAHLSFPWHRKLDNYLRVSGIDILVCDYWIRMDNNKDTAIVRVRFHCAELLVTTLLCEITVITLYFLEKPVVQRFLVLLAVSGSLSLLFTLFRIVIATPYIL